MENTFVIEKLTELLIKQDMKDKKEKRKECISKVAAYKSLIDFLKEIKEYEKNSDYRDDAVDSIAYFTSKDIH